MIIVKFSWMKSSMISNSVIGIAVELPVDIDDEPVPVLVEPIEEAVEP